MKWVNWFLVGFLIVSCSSTKFYEPLQKGEQVLTGHFGGPIANVPGIGSIPLPFTSIGYANGISEKNDCLWIYLSNVFNVRCRSIGFWSMLWNLEQQI